MTNEKKNGFLKDFILGDCMDYLPGFADNSFDLAICDPPYGIGFGDYERGGSGIKTKERHTKKGKKKWDKNIPCKEYFTELLRVSKNQIVFGGNYFIQLAKRESPNLKKIADFNEYIKRSSENWLFWYKQNPVPNFADGELAWLSFNKNNQFNFRYYGNLEGETCTGHKYHPTQKPIPLYKWILRNYANPDFKIIDTHVGSGSSLIAFDDFGCEYVGFEIDLDYYKSALKRLNEHKAQFKLF